MDVYRSIFITLLFVLSNSVCAQMYKWVDENGNVSFSDRPPPSGNISKDVRTPGASNKDKKVRGFDEGEQTQAKRGKNDKVYPTYPKSIVLETRKLLKARDFDKLNKMLAGYQLETESDIRKEELVFSAYSAFDLKDNRYEKILNEWLKYSPKLYQPYLARAYYYYWQGWEARGSKWASETSSEQFDAMNAYFRKVSDDLAVVFEKNKKVLPAYSLLIGMMSTQGNHEKMYGVVDSALAVEPGTYRIRSRFLRALAPRWGGSFEAMQKVVEQSDGYVSLNPRLKSLPGQLFREAGDMKVSLRQYKAAEKLYLKALGYGKEYGVLFRLGKNHYRQKNYQQAIALLTSALAEHHEDGGFYYWRAKAYAKHQEYDNAAFDIERANLLMPGDAKVAEWRDWLASKVRSKGYEEYKNRKPQKALSYLNLGIRLKADDAFMYFRRAQAYIDLHELDAATVDVKKAISLEPNEYSFYKLLDWLLAKKRDWVQIISYWDEYIALNPDDGKAYVERGGAYYHKGDMRAAVNDAKVAADMGNMEGKEAYEKFKHYVR